MGGTFLEGSLLSDFDVLELLFFFSPSIPRYNQSVAAVVGSFSCCCVPCIICISSPLSHSDCLFGRPHFYILRLDLRIRKDAHRLRHTPKTKEQDEDRHIDHPRTVIRNLTPQSELVPTSPGPPPSKTTSTHVQVRQRSVSTDTTADRRRHTTIPASTSGSNLIYTPHINARPHHDADHARLLPHQLPHRHLRPLLPGLCALPLAREAGSGIPRAQGRACTFTAGAALRVERDSDGD